MINLIKVGGRYNAQIEEYEVDTYSEISQITPTPITGSIVRVISTGKTYKLLSGGSWAEFSEFSGGSSLPAVTTDDNGKLLGVAEGSWTKVTAPADCSPYDIPFTLTESSGSYTATTNASFSDAFAASDPSTNKRYLRAKCSIGGVISYLPIGVRIDTSGSEMLIFAANILSGTTVVYMTITWMSDGGTAVTATPTAGELPSVTVSDNGKLLGVSGGVWAKIDAPSGLPSVTGSDDGKVLGVVNGSWTKVATSSNFDFNVALDMEHGTGSSETTFAQLVAAIESGKTPRGYATVQVNETVSVDFYVPRIAVSHFNGSIVSVMFSVALDLNYFDDQETNEPQIMMMAWTADGIAFGAEHLAVSGA